MIKFGDFAKARIEQEAADTVRYRIQFRHNDIGRKEIDALVSLFTSGKIEYRNCIEIINRAKLDDELFNNIINYNKNNNLKLHQADDKLPNVELPQQDLKEENHLNLENVSDFTKDGKNYIKMHYSNGTIRIIENSLNGSGQEIFKDYQSRYGINSNDGAINATNIFETLINEFHEVTLTNIKDMTKEEYNNLKPKEKELFDIIRKKYVGYEIIASPEENIYVISSAGKDEKVVSVEERDGKYVIYDVDEKGYKHNNQDNNSVTNDINCEHEYVDVDNVNTNTEVINFNENEEYEKAQDDPTYVNKKDKVKVLTLKRQYSTSKAGYMDAALLSLIVGMSSASLIAILIKLITR